MQRIEDVEFLKTLFSRFCHRRASTIDDINALGRLWIEVRDTPNAPMLISICDGVGSVLDIKWRQDVAWPARRLNINDGIRDADEEQLGRFVRRFLLRHGCIIREVLKRPLYRGEILWGRTSSCYGRELGPDRGTRESAQRKTPEETWIRLDANESLRIIDADLAARVDARRMDCRTRYFASLGTPGTMDGRMPEKAHGKYLLSGGMLICPTCGGHMEGLRFPKEVYVCSVRRRKPGACTNKLALSMSYADDQVLEMLDGELLSTKFINELLSLVEQGEVDDTARVQADRDRLRGEVEKLVGSIALGEAPSSIVSAIRDREAEIARLEVRLRTPKRVAPKVEELRGALEQRAEAWKLTLKAEPKVARLLIRRMIGPLLLPEDSPRPDFIEATAAVKTGLLDGLAKIHDMASPHGTNRDGIELYRAFGA